MPRRRPSRVGLVALIALLGAFCAARPASVASSSEPQPTRTARRVPAPVTRLQRALTAIFTQPAVDNAQWSVRVDSLAGGDPLYVYNAQRLLVPASNQKVITAAVAAERLGWDYRYTTRLMTNGTVDRGTLNGDLYVVGDGDPSINPRHAERWNLFDEWGARLSAMGIRIIAGHLIGDDNLVDEPGWGAGWSWDDLQFGYGAAATALQYSENQVEVTVGPGLTPGAAAIVTLSPAGSGLLVDVKATTAERGRETTIDVSRWPGTAFLSVRGAIATGAEPVTVLAAVDNPTQFYVTALRDALARQGIFVAGAQDIDGLPDATPPPAALRELLVDRSPPLADLADVMMKWSRNEYAETLLTSLAAFAPDAATAAPASTGMSTAAATMPSPAPGTAPPASLAAFTSPSLPLSPARGLATVRATLETWGVPPDSIRARDGSGLSRMDYLSADTLVTVLTRMWTDPRHRDAFRATLPVAGISGTMAGRLKGTTAAGRVWAKTGSMSNVRTLSGYIETRAGEPLVFSILANGFTVPGAEIDAVMDKALLELMALPKRR